MVTAEKEVVFTPKKRLLCEKSVRFPQSSAILVELRYRRHKLLQLQQHSVRHVVSGETRSFNSLCHSEPLRQGPAVGQSVETVHRQSVLCTIGKTEMFDTFEY